ncbi:unnamed protein product [Jaminaea pallidilutea]
MAYIANYDIEALFHPDSPPSPAPGHRAPRQKRPGFQAPALSASTSSATSNSSSSSQRSYSSLPLSSHSSSSLSSMQSFYSPTTSSNKLKSAAQSTEAAAKSLSQYPNDSSSKKSQRPSHSPMSASTSSQPLPASAKAPCSPSTRFNALPLSLAPEDEAGDYTIRGESGAAEEVLHTPRRGRRVGGVHMGWESPSASQHAFSTYPPSLQPGFEVTARPVTLPRAKASASKIRAGSGHAVANAVSATPTRKRSRASGNDEVSLSSARRTEQSSRGGPALFDHQGYASAAYDVEVPRLHQRSASNVSASPSFTAPPPAPPRFDHLAAFKSGQSSQSGPHMLAHAPESQDTTSADGLVAVEVKGMGRVAVNRQVAAQLGALSEEQLKASVNEMDQFESEAQPNHSSSGLSADDHAAIRAAAAASHLQTPSTSSACMVPSPSFSLASHFPASEEGSPSMRGVAFPDRCKTSSSLAPELLNRVHSFKDRILSGGPMTPRKPSSSSALITASAPRLSSSQSCTLPTLDWPDSVDGPWSPAGKGRESLDTSGRVRVVSKWLDVAEAEDDSGSDDRKLPNIRNPQHPMVAKILRDRQRRASAASAAALAAAASDDKPKKRGRKTNKERERLRLAELQKHRRNKSLRTPKKRSNAGGLAFTPSSLAYTPSSLGRSVLSSGGALSDASLIDCYCGSQNDDVPMVQCDACHHWYHMGCAGIAGAEDLEETWFCLSCEQQARARGSQKVRSGAPSDIFSPVSTSKLGQLQAPSTGGSFTSMTPRLPAFPRTYASHVGVGTPSGQPNTSAGRDHAVEGSLPVFTHPSTDSPSALAGIGKSAAGLPLESALALAPSPSVDGVDGLTGNGDGKPHPAQGRARASRIGWHSMEPSSPLDRKSWTAPRPQAAHHHQHVGATGNAPQQSRGRGRQSSGLVDAHHLVSDDAFDSHGMPHASRSEWDLASLHARRSSQWGRQQHDASGNRNRTPSPTRLPFTFSTPSRHAQGGLRAGRDGEASADCRDSDDVFSTPSRHLPGSAWWGGRHPAATSALTPGKGDSHASSGGQLGGLQTPSRSTRRREPSAWALGLATPGSGRDRDRDLLFSTDISGGAYSAGVPSLVFSSGGVVGDGSSAIEEFPHAHWNSLGSPTRSTRALPSNRRRQVSSNLATSSLGSLGSQPSTSSVRSSSTKRRGDRQAEDSSDPLTSSSPYPRTPSADYGSGSGGAARMVGASGGLTSTPGSPTPNRGRMASLTARRKGVLAAGSGVGKASSAAAAGGPGSAGNGGPAAAGRVRQISHSADINNFGLGLDLDEILDYF